MVKVTTVKKPSVVKFEPTKVIKMKDFTLMFYPSLKFVKLEESKDGSRRIINRGSRQISLISKEEMSALREVLGPGEYYAALLSPINKGRTRKYDAIVVVVRNGRISKIVYSRLIKHSRRF